MGLKLFVFTTAIVFSITSGFNIEQEPDKSPAVNTKPDVVWDNYNDQDKFIKEKVSTDVPSSEGEPATKSETENAPAAEEENVPKAEEENVPASGGEDAKKAEEEAPKAEALNAPKAEEENVPAAASGFEGDNTSPSDGEKEPSSQLDSNTERKESHNEPNPEPVEVSSTPEGPDGAAATGDSQTPLRIDLRHSTYPPPSTIYPNHKFGSPGEHHPPGVHGSFPPPPTIYPNHSIAGPGEHHPPGVHGIFPPPPTIYPNHSLAEPGEHHPPGVHDHYDEENNATRRNFPRLLHPTNAPLPRQTTTTKPKIEPKSDSDSPLSKLTGFFKGFFDKIQSYFK